jgi:hypothetical protein
MRRLSLFTAAVLLLSVWMIAQNTSPSGTSSSSQTSTSSSQTTTSTQTTDGNETTIEGCLSGSGGSYALVDSSSGKTYQLQGDSARLANEVGHQVRIRGTESSASAALPGTGGTSSQSSTGQPSTGQTAGTQFSVRSVHKIAESCTPPPSSK